MGQMFLGSAGICGSLSGYANSVYGAVSRTFSLQRISDWCLIISLKQYGYSNGSQVFSQENNETRKLNDRLRERKSQKLSEREMGTTKEALASPEPDM